MKNKVMLGMWRYILNIPPFVLEKKRAGSKEKIMANLAFLTPEHRLVHHYAVRQLPYAGGPLELSSIAQALGMKPDRVKALLDDLEAHMTFLFRNASGDVVWAYPVTAEKTPHHVTFDSGETVYAA